MKINISFLNPTWVSSVLMRPFFLIFVECFIVYKGLSDPPQDAPPRWVLLSKAGDAEAEVSTWDVVCSRAHSKSVKDLIRTQVHRLLGLSG